jgi:prepilin-type N-terminal cleavage/methylation domain-containing protein
MRKRQVGQKGFTLIEIVVVLVISAILIGILFRVYTTTADISLRVKHQKQLWMWVVTMQTVLQNIVDTHTIDYNTMSWYTRNTTSWRTNMIPLIDDAQQKSTLQINWSWELVYTTYSGWALVWSASILWTDVSFSGATFIAYPSQDPKITRCTASTAQCFNQINHPWFWLIGKLYPKRYDKMFLPIHTFFSFLKK